ncbi:transposase, partial [Candidatus Woesearchaeota archaeon]|nr:transposase [Candidatus Woesearchaeota archaeon]
MERITGLYDLHIILNFKIDETDISIERRINHDKIILPNRYQQKRIIYRFNDRTRKELIYMSHSVQCSLPVKKKMNTDESKKIYSLRKITVEPVYGHIKQNLGFREFFLYGLEKVKIEMNLISIAHNLQKIHRMMEGNNGMVQESSSVFAFLRNFY